MTESSAPNRQLPSSSSRPSFLAAFLTAGFAAALLLSSSVSARAQADAPSSAADPGAAAPAKPNIAVTNQKPAKTRKQKEEKVVLSKDTKKAVKKNGKTISLEGMDAKLPDKALFDKAQDATKHGRFDVARLDLLTLLNTYPESQYQMQAKLAVADSWFKEGGSAALTQAEQEYKDFITFFPNAPEAAEAQMRVGDIYFKQMDKPDRDYTKTLQAEQEYRLMLQQFPDSPLVPQARQRLREVQESLASREADIADFYATRPNLPAAIARYQTVADSYPLYSHMDTVLLQLGDAYEAEAKIVRGWRNIPEAARARLLRIDDERAAAAYRKVVLEHSAAPHVEDARDRLVGMGLPIPVPTPQQVADSEALENSRGQYTLSKRAIAIFGGGADTVPAATIGVPPLEDVKPTLAPDITRQAVTDFNNSMNPAATPRPGQPLSVAAPETPADSPATPASGAPPSLENVPGAGANTGSAPLDTSVPAASGVTSGASTSVGGIEIVHDSSTTPAAANPNGTPPAFPGTAPAANRSIPPPDPNGGIRAVGGSTATQLAPIEQPTAAPAPINEVKPGSQPAAQTAAANGKKPKADCDKSDQSCSNHKKKKGLAKLNPF